MVEYRTKNMMPGMIMLWSGAIVDIPSGWHLCDGTMNTPDLRDKFVPCTGATYPVDDTGGSSSHNHIGTGTGHSHPIAPNATISTAVPHPYDWNTEVAVVTTVTDGKSHIPPYHALCYIMKL